MRGIEFTLPGSDSKLTMLVADLFEQQGLKIVHCSKSFETHKDVVRSNSVIGQFINYCKINNVNLDFQIDEWCKNMSHIGKVDISLKYRNKKYDIGTLCPIDTDKGVFCLSSFCYSTSPFSADELSIGEYISYWDNLWNNITKLSVDRSVVNVVVPGGKFVSVGAGNFTFDQRFGIIARSFFKFSQRSTICNCLNVCVSEKEIETIDYQGWEETVLPYLFKMSQLPIEWSEETGELRRLKIPIEGSYQKKVTHEPDTKGLFIDDFCDMVNNLASNNGNKYEQFDGSKKTTILINVDTYGLYSYIDCLQREYPELLEFLSKRRGSFYDKNRIFQLIGLLHQKSLYYGELNRRSLIKLSLASEEQTSKRWSHLGDSINNIINYVGQKLSDRKKNYPSIYTKLVDSIPEDKRK